jgi:hypothetical protein
MSMLTTLQVILWFLAVLPILLILLVLVAATCGHCSLVQTIRIAANAACPNCGKAVGRVAIIEGKDREAQRVGEVRKQHPGVKFMIVAEWDRLSALRLQVLLLSGQPEI